MTFHNIWGSDLEENIKKNELKDDVVVADYGKEIDIDVLANDIINTDDKSFTLGDDATNINGTFAKKDETLVSYTPFDFLEDIETASYSVKNTSGDEDTAKITVIPATTVYYEDDFNAITFDGDWKNEASESSAKDKVQDDGHVGEGNNYGYDSGYGGDLLFSAGGAKYFEASSDEEETASASFTFKGTGFDIISLTDNASGTLLVNVTNESGDRVYQRVVNNKYTTQGGRLYQVPVINCYDLSYGTYTVTLTPGTNEGFTFYLDAIRVYNPMGSSNETANAAYTTDKEINASVVEVRDTILNDAESYASSANKTLYVDNEAEAVTDLSKYESIGPNNELYLKNGNKIFTTLKTASTTGPSSVQIGARAADGRAVSLALEVFRENEDGNIESVGSFERDITSSTDMYYDVTSLFGAEGLDFGKGVTISIGYGQTGDGILSLTNFKTTGEAVTLLVGDSTYKTVSSVSTATGTSDVSIDAGTLVAGDEASDDISADEPGETVTGNDENASDTAVTVNKVKVNKKSYKKGAKATLKITTSANAKSLVIKLNGKKVKILSKKSKVSNGKKIWTVKIKVPSKKGTYKYSVKAKAKGIASSAKSFKIKVKK